MDDQLFSILQSVASGLDNRQREQIIRILRNPPTGRTPADLVQLLPLKELIDELTDLTTAYSGRDWQDISGNAPGQVTEFRDTYLKLHRDIADYFTRVSYGGFSMNVLDGYKDVQERVILEDELAGKRRGIQRKWDFYHEVTAMPQQIRLLPDFSLARATEYGGALVVSKTDSSGEVSENAMREFSVEGNDEDSEHLHARFFLATLFSEQQPARIEAVVKDVDEFERSFQRVSDSEGRKLTAFKRNQDTKYCTQNYLIAYNEWCLGRFKGLIGR